MSPRSGEASRARSKRSGDLARDGAWRWRHARTGSAGSIRVIGSSVHFSCPHGSAKHQLWAYPGTGCTGAVQSAHRCACRRRRAAIGRNRPAARRRGDRTRTGCGDNSLADTRLDQSASGGCSSRPYGTYARYGTRGEHGNAKPVIGMARKRGYIGRASCAAVSHTPT